MTRNKRWLALALPLLLQVGLGDVADAAGTTVEETVESAATPRGVRVAGQEVGRITNPHVKVSFNVDPNLVGVSTPTYGPGANPDDPGCPADHDPTGAQTVNMTVVADLQAGATGSYRAVVDYTETHANGDIHNHVAHDTGTQPIGPVSPPGHVERQAICIFT